MQYSLKLNYGLMPTSSEFPCKEPSCVREIKVFFSQLWTGFAASARQWNQLCILWEQRISTHSVCLMNMHTICQLCYTVPMN